MKITFLYKNIFKNIQKDIISTLTTISTVIAIILLSQNKALVVKSNADSIAPITTINSTPNNPNGENGWYTSHIKIDLKSTDLESGVQKIFYKVNNNEWKSKSFYNTLNYINDPSFEYNTSSYWSYENTYDSIINFDYNNKVSGARSIKIDSKTNNYFGINNKDNFVTAAPYSNLSISFYQKNELENNSNLYLKIYSVELTDNNILKYTLISEKPLSNNNPDFIKDFHTFTLNNYDALGFYLDFGINGIGTMWIDDVVVNKISNIPNVTIYLNEQGTNTLEYYSLDNNNNKEDIKSISYKIDTIAPNEYIDYKVQNIDLNKNLVRFSTIVKDNASGVSDNSKIFQYKVSSQTEYGTNDNLLECNSNWISNNWRDLEQFKIINNKSAFIQTPTINICENTTNGCKAIRFKVKDNAGNENSGELCINGSWAQFNKGTKIYAGYGVDILSNYNKEDELSYIEVQKETINYGTKGRYYTAKNVELDKNDFEYYKKIVNDIELANSIDNVSGAFLIDKDYTILDNLTFNSNDIFSKVVLIKGDLNIESNIITNTGSSLIFIVKGNVNISKNVSTLDATIISDETINTAFNLTTDDLINYNTQLYINGSLIAEKVLLNRRFSNNNIAAEIFNYDPKYLLASMNLFNLNKVIWNYNK